VIESYRIDLCSYHGDWLVSC